MQLNTEMLPISLIIATKDRPAVLSRTLESLSAQHVLPCEMIIIDGSSGDESQKVAARWTRDSAPQVTLHWQRAEKLGAAVQRNQGVAVATQSVIWFLDDDILLEPECLVRLWSALNSDSQIGGVNAMITNQRYQSPGWASRFMFRLMGGTDDCFAGRVLGPAVNLLPEDRDELPDTVPVEWLNTTCTLYRREALPVPPFPSHVTGYSMMEDLTLSATVAKNWTLLNARTARIFHDSQPGSHKSDPVALAEMELVNRYYVMTQVLNRRGLRMLMKLALWESFQFLSLLRSNRNPTLWAQTLWGKLRALPRCLDLRDDSASCP
jgi:glycosyltransferase involved in cell wall biosynthesis